MNNGLLHVMMIVTEWYTSTKGIDRVNPQKVDFRIVLQPQGGGGGVGYSIAQCLYAMPSEESTPSASPILDLQNAHHPGALQSTV